MRVEAIKIPEGLLIPQSAGLPEIHADRVMLEIEFLDPAQADVGYAALDQLVGLCETGDSTAALEHDARVYWARPS